MRVPSLISVLLAATLVAWSTGCAARSRSDDARSRVPDAPTIAEPTTSAPLTIGETFTINSRVLGEPRRVNVFVPTVYGQRIEGPMPVLYMPDGGLDEDFLHIAGLVQVLVSDGSMRPFILVGVPNTARRRDLTGPTTKAEDLKIAPVVGRSAEFRRFIREELMPEVRARYTTTDETAIVGESLAGLFVVETFFVEPGLFKTYIAIDPSLWWAGGSLVHEAAAHMSDPALRGRSLFVATSSEPEMEKLGAELAAAFTGRSATGPAFRYMPMPAEGHGTIYHPAALRAFREVLAPATAGRP